MGRNSAPDCSIESAAMRALVVEDETKMASLLKRGLEEEGMAVDIALDGEQGFFAAQSNPYDLLILDITLPIMDGIELCRKLRADSVTTPALMLTARDSVETKVRGLDS